MTVKDMIQSSEWGRGSLLILIFLMQSWGGGDGVRNEEGRTLFATDEKSVGFLHMQEKNY